MVGRLVFDADGEFVGWVSDLWPDDGGGEPELLLVRLMRWARRRYVPLDGAEWVGPAEIRLPWRWDELEDAPDAEDRGWGDPATVAQAHWRMLGD